MTFVVEERQNQQSHKVVGEQLLPSCLLERQSVRRGRQVSIVREQRQPSGEGREPERSKEAPE